MKDLSSVNMPDPIRKRFGYGQLWPLRPACSQNRTGSYMPDPTCRILFSSVSPKKAWVILCKTDWIPSGWPGQGLAQRIWSGSKPVCRNHQARFLAERNRLDPACLLGSVSESKSQRLLSQYKISDSELHKFVCFPQYFIQSFYFTTVHLIC